MAVSRQNDYWTIARKLYDTKMNIYASQSWVHQNPLQKKPEDLDHANAFTLPYLAKGWTLFKGKNSYTINTNYRIYANDFGPLTQGLMHNPVISALPTLCGDEFVKKGNLVKLLPSYQVETPGPIYGVYPSKQFMPRKTKELLNFLHDKFEQLP